MVITSIPSFDSIRLPNSKFWGEAGFGKLYVTNSAFSNGIERLCVIILHLFFPSVKFFLPSCECKVGMPSSGPERGQGAGGNGRSP
jgi:hypothetical protein